MAPTPALKVVASAAPVQYASAEVTPFFKSLHWSADGTTVIASSSSNRVCSYALPETLLEPSTEGPLRLRAQGTVSLPEPTQAIGPCPYYSLAHPSTQTVLVACRDHPIQLHSLFPAVPAASAASNEGHVSPGEERHDENDEEDSAASPSSSLPASSSPSSPSHYSRLPQLPHEPPIAAYPLIKHETEAFLTPSALIWPAPGTHFTVGTTNLVAHFDASRPGEPPVLRIPTIPSARHISKGSGVGMRGTVSALAAQPDSSSAASSFPGAPAVTTGLVAAGTWTRWVGLYDVSRSGSCVATWGLPSFHSSCSCCSPTSTASSAAGQGGTGIVQVVWSPCGRYLLLNERRAAHLAVYDVRVTGRLLTLLSGRSAPGSNQRLSCDVFPSQAGDGSFEVWAGTRDGRVVVWDSVGGEPPSLDVSTDDGGGDSCDALPPSWDWQTHHRDSAVGAAALHPSGSVLATCAGSWEVVDDRSDDESDNSGSDSPQTGDKARVRITADTTLKIWSISAGQPC